MNVVPPTTDGIRTAVEALRSGKIVAYPTETQYGLGVDPGNDEALKRLFRGKRRSEDSPVLLIIDGVAQLEGVAALSEKAQRFIEHFWPGPLSLLLFPEKEVSSYLSGAEGKICVRCPYCETARTLCREFGAPITSTSANVAGRPPARAVAALDLPDIAVAIDGGLLPGSPPSTVFDPDTGQVLREGVISENALRALA
ncbi:MAG: L-threonylcarbamoyladenylate synthase [Candidatus Hydrogenedentota bacterium]